MDLRLTLISCPCELAFSLSSRKLSESPFPFPRLVDESKFQLLFKIFVFNQVFNIFHYNFNIIRMNERHKGLLIIVFSRIPAHFQQARVIVNLFSILENQNPLIFTLHESANFQLSSFALGNVSVRPPGYLIGSIVRWPAVPGRAGPRRSVRSPWNGGLVGTP